MDTSNLEYFKYIKEIKIIKNEYILKNITLERYSDIIDDFILLECLTFLFN